MFNVLLAKNKFTEFVSVKDICNHSIEISLVSNAITHILKNKDKNIELEINNFFNQRALEIDFKNKTINKIIEIKNILTKEIKENNENLLIYLIDCRNEEQKIYESWSINLK